MPAHELWIKSAQKLLDYFNYDIAMQFEHIFTFLNEVYTGTLNPHERDPLLSLYLREAVDRLRDKVAAITHTIPEVRPPGNMDHYFLVSWPLKQDLPSHPIHLDIPSLTSPARYLMGRVCNFALIAELSWLELGFEDGKTYRRSAELLDPAFLKAEPKAESIAIASLQAAEDLDLELLPWAFLRSPAPFNWPRQFWMPDKPQIRNYLFPGFFETWPNISSS